MTNDYIISHSKGIYNNITSEIKQDIKNDVPSLPIIYDSHPNCPPTLKERLSIMQQLLFQHTTKEDIAWPLNDVLNFIMSLLVLYIIGMRIVKH